MTSPTVPRRTLLAGLLGLSAAGLTGCAGAASGAGLGAAEPLPTAVDPSAELVISIHATEVALRASGELGKLPFKVPQWPNLSAGPDVIQAFRARSVDLASNAGIPPIQAAAINVDARIVAVLTKKEPLYTYATAPGSPIRSLTDLRGKKIAFSQGQAQGLVVLRTLKEQGLTAADVELVALPSTKFLVGLQSRQVDIAPLGEPVLTKYLAQYAKDGAIAIPMTAIDYLGILWAPGEVLADARKVAAIRAFIPFWARSKVWAHEKQDVWRDEYYVKDQAVSLADAKRIVAAEETPIFPRNWDRAVAWQQESADLLAEGGFIKPVQAEKLFDRRFETIAADAVAPAYQE